MIKSLILTAVMVAIIYFILKKMTIYRCPQCASTHITKLKKHNYETSETVYFCAKCKTAFTKTKQLN